MYNMYMISMYVRINIYISYYTFTELMIKEKRNSNHDINHKAILQVSLYYLIINSSHKGSLMKIPHVRGPIIKCLEQF